MNRKRMAISGIHYVRFASIADIFSDSNLTAAFGG